MANQANLGGYPSKNIGQISDCQGVLDIVSISGTRSAPTTSIGEEAQDSFYESPFMMNATRGIIEKGSFCPQDTNYLILL